MITIRCKKIKKFYSNGDGRTEALKGIDLEISTGELTLLVGPSGSGKTTLLSIIHTILTPSEGELYLLDHDVNQMTEWEKAEFRSHNIGVIFQALYLIPTLTVLENVTLPLIILGIAENEANERAIAVLEKVNMAHKKSVPPTHLSRGQQQRVAIARALINDPKILICDEPTSALDQTAGAEFMTLLRELCLHSHRTVFVVTHDARIFPFSDRIIKINDGMLEEQYA